MNSSEAAANSTGSAEVDAVVRSKAADGKAGVMPLVGRSARNKQIIAFLVMLVPFVGFLISLYWVWTDRATTIDYILFGTFYFLHMFGITAGFHRYVAHKTFSASPWFEGFLMICGSLAGQGPIMFWVTTHRRHHAFSDRPGDPHSPNLTGDGVIGKIKGLWHAHMPWMMAKEVSSWTVYAPDVLRNRRLFFYHRTYFLWVALGLALPAALGACIGRSVDAALGGFLFGGLSRMFLANQAAWCVGSLSHMIGSRPFKTGDLSANNWTVAILTFGEGRQNNHHAFPGSYRHGMKWFEPDLTGWILKILASLGIVWGLKNPDENSIARVRL